jgi:hypothetical protein
MSGLPKCIYAVLFNKKAVLSVVNLYKFNQNASVVLNN